MEDLVNVLSDIQKKLKAPKKQYNAFGKYKYRKADDILEAVKPLLPNGYIVLLSDDIVQISERYYLKATASLCSKSDRIEVFALARESLTKKGMDDSQITGAASSYARKYALGGLFGIDDNDDADSLNNSKSSNNNSKFKTAAQRNKWYDAAYKKIEEIKSSEEAEELIKNIENNLKQDALDNPLIKDSYDQLISKANDTKNSFLHIEEKDIETSTYV